MKLAPTPAKAFALTPKQREARALFGSTALHNLLFGGSRSGKTFVILRTIVVRAISASRSRHLIARQRAKHAKASIWLDTLPTVMRLCFPGLPFETNESDLRLILPNGAELWCGGLDDKDRTDKILGTEFASIYINECSQVSHDAVVTLRSRLAQNCIADALDQPRPLALKAFYDLNPVGKQHWTYREFVQLVDPKSGRPLRAGSRAHAVMNPADNPHLPRAYIDEVLADMPERQRKRFLEGLYIDEIPGALWRLEWLEHGRLDEPPKDLERVVVAIDPSVAGSESRRSEGVWDRAECGIVVAAKGRDGRGYVLADKSDRLGPDGWAREAVRAFHAYNADYIVAEANNGGELVRSVLRTVDPSIRLKLVHASRGKVTRAEPISALYEQGKVSHCDRFAQLEEQMTSYTGAAGDTSPDRMDALVWALSELMVRRQASAQAF
ncbi:MAG: phage terminase large subunit [Hyphomonadaceae bacterium]|nr:phage terminase large subunit [Hyphomonadaceae bacterium]